MDVREKLVELIRCADYHPCRGAARTIGSMFTTEFIKDIASHLIANGVTVQELDGCEYCKEDREGYRKMFGAFSITNPFHGNEWLINTGHCKPRQIYFCPMCGRKLPQPPKGE